MRSLSSYLTGAGFESVRIEPKEESRAVISQWLPGSGAEDYVVSANISATKSVTARSAISSANCCSSSPGYC